MTGHTKLHNNTLLFIIIMTMYILQLNIFFKRNNCDAKTTKPFQ